MTTSATPPKSSLSNININLIDAVGLLFLGLKLSGHIATWSWWWVLLPFYGPVALMAIYYVLTFIVAFLLNLLKGTPPTSP